MVIVLFVLLTIIAMDLVASYKFLIIKTYNIIAPNIDEQFSAVLISDLHGNQFGKYNRQLISKVEILQPDFILMDGDFIQSDKTAKDTYALISELIEIAPVYYSLGNQEESYIAESGLPLSDFINSVENAGAIVLEQNYVDIVVDGQSVRIGGMYAYAFANDGASLEGSTSEERMDEQVYAFLSDFQDTDSYTIMLAHRPDSFIFGAASSTWNIDLVVSGHTHGGQIVIPLVGGLWAPDQGFFPTYDAGYFKKDQIALLITSGLGSKTESLPRLNNLPGIVEICFVPE